MAIGYLQIKTISSNQKTPLPNVLITVSKKIKQEVVYTTFSITNEVGESQMIHCMCPLANSLDTPYALYHVELKKAGYQTQIIQNVKIVEGIPNLLDVEMVPLNKTSNKKKMFTYPKTSLSSEDIRDIQRKMNRIAQEYKEIPVHDEHGNMDDSMIECLLSFQKYFNLKQTGWVDLSTWNKLMEVVQQMSDGETTSLIYPPFPGNILRIGSQGMDVSFIQDKLKFLTMYYPSLPLIIEDGYYGTLSERCVIAFQSMLGIEEDGLVGVNTWNKIMGIYNELNSL